MHLLECVWFPLHVHLGGNPCSGIQLLGIAHPVEEKIFQV